MNIADKTQWSIDKRDDVYELTDKRETNEVSRGIGPIRAGDVDVALLYTESEPLYAIKRDDRGIAVMYRVTGS